MKNYYEILGIPETADQQQIKSAFRKLAFQYHPDKNPGNEKAAEAKFKEINEAFAVLGDEEKRKQYDLARKGAFAGSGFEGFNFSQQDIFNGIFTNQAFYEELNRIFNQAGLRFDRDFFGQTFSNGNTFFRFYSNVGSPNTSYNFNSASSKTSSYKPGLMERIASRIFSGITRFILKKIFGIEYKPDLNIQTKLEITAQESLTGVEKEITYQRGPRKKKLLVIIPAGISSSTKIRLKGMGLVQNKEKGDLIIQIKIRQEPPLHSG
ncbi:MAG: J domain-containing protein [Dehalococcoidales bacterium]|nr:J domain-containing protein [Dehalococcoidales bacterium]